MLTQFLTGRKHGQSLEALGHGFYGSVVQLCLQKQCENYQKFHGGTGGRRSHRRPPPKYAAHCHR